jgi:predicted outer membrane repeat protein
MLSVLAENQTHIFIEHATNSSGNKIKLVNSVFRNSSLSGRLSFIKSEWNAEAMSLTSSTLNIGKNTNISFMHNLVRKAVLFLNSSTLNLDRNVHMTFVSNSRALLAIFNSTLNVVADTSLIFIGNSKTGDEGAAMFVVRSTMNIEGNLHFINNMAYSQGAVNFQISTLNIRKYARIVFVTNLARRQAGGILLGNSVLNAEDNAEIAFINNSAGKIGSMGVLSSTLHVRHNASLHFIGNSASTYGGSLMIEFSAATIENNAHITFTNNVADTAGGMAMFSATLYVSHNAHILFDSNHAVVGGGALYALNCTIYFKNNAQMTFINNSAFSAGAFVLISSELHLMSHPILTFINNTAINFGGALFSYKSKYSIENATNKFIYNSAANGGAMALLSSKIEVINGISNLIFEKNSAKEKGGAIYVDPDKFEYALQVQYDTEYNHLLDTCLYYVTDPTSMEQHLYFINNLAGIAGDDIYGASLEWCNGSVVHLHPKNNSSLSSVSGNPLRVCRCDDQHTPLCHNISGNHYSLSYYPGETTTVSVVVVGGDWGATHGMVYARFVPQNSSSILKPSSQHNQWMNGSQCTSLNYTVYSNQSVQLVLSTVSYSDITCDNNVTRQYYAKACTFFSPLHIDFKVQPCPPGFSLQGNPPGCSCYSLLADNGVGCNIFKSEVTFSWNSSLWITVYAKKIILSKYCPFDYCKDTKVIRGASGDQCSFNRAGRLCGGCKENYSLAIGSSHCIYCSNDHNMTLLIFFAAAGFLLVFFISILNLTVTQGMINGLIFYANIVWTYQSVLFPNEIPSKLIFFKAFIAWLNLDFGIEMCYMRNLNAFWKSWLQFVFPFYLWSIAGLMIMLARYSSRLTTLFGNRAVPVLVTLILLSYMKLLRTAVEILEFSILTVLVYGNSNGTNTVTATSNSLVWSVDGTLDYFGYPHILLFVAALFTLLFLWLPYTLLLLLIQWIRRVSHHRLLRWTIRLNPFYDANFAPLKHKHQYWFGLLLLIRGIIFIIFSSNFSIPDGINLLILLIFSVLLLFYMLAISIHKSHALLVFHSTFFLNLCFLSGFIIFSHSKSKGRSSMQTSATLLSTGIAFLQFCCIILYQIYSLCRSCGVGRSLNEVHRVHEDQVHAILDISSRIEHCKYSVEKQPLIDPIHNSDEPTY